MKPSIGIIGNGTVGSTLAGWFAAQGHEVRLYDTLPERATHTEIEVLAADWVFLCMYLPNNGLGMSDYDTLHRLVTESTSPNPVVIRSTVIPGTCDTLMAYTGQKVMFWPEFLTEANAFQDFNFPELQIVGATERERTKAAELLRMIPLASKRIQVILPHQAELLKHVLSAWLATKVSWFNQLYDAIGERDYMAVSGVLRCEPRVGGTHMDIFQDGYRGWGGTCFTKDVPIFQDIAKMPLLKEVIKYNTELRTKEESAIDRVHTGKD